MRAVSLFLAALTFSAAVQAGTSYQVKGEATLQASPDLATINIPFLECADSPEAAATHVRDAARQMIGVLEKAGVAERDVEWTGENNATQIHDKAGATKFAALQFVNVSVRDFATLPKLTELVAANRTDWNVAYSFVDRTKFAGELGNNLLDGCRFVQFHQLATAPAGAVRLCDRRIQWQQFLLRIRIEKIKVGVFLMKTADRFLVVKIVNALVVSVPDFDEIIRELTRSRFALGQKTFEIASMPANRFAQFRQLA